MKKVGLVLPYNHTLLSIGAILDVIETVNRLFSSQGKEQPFTVTVFKTQEQIQNNEGDFHGYPVKSVRSNQKVDLVFIPALTTARIKDVIEKKLEIHSMAAKTVRRRR